MGYDIGPKIGIDGEAEFRSAIQNLNTTLKTLGTEMGSVTSQFGKNQQSEEALTAKNKVLNKEIESQKDKLSKLKEGLAQSAAKYGENDEKTQKWQQAVNKAQETLNKQNNELDENKKSLENLKNGVDDAAVSEQDATKKTSVFGEVLKANLTSTAIKSGIQCIKDGFSKIAQGIQSATGKLKEAITESVEYGDNVDKMSQKLGMSTDAYQKWSYVTERAGTSIDGMKGGMKKLATAAQSNAKEFQKLGISQKDVKSLNQEDLFEKTIEGLAGMKAGTERTALASKLLGKSAVELGPLLNEGTGEIKKQMDIAERYGLVMSQKAVKGSAEFKDSLTTLQGVITGLRNKFIGEFFPSLTMVTDGLSKVFSGVDVSGGLKSIDTGIKQFSDKLNQVLPHVQEVGGKILSTLGQAIATNLPTILSSATKIASTITTGIINAAPMLISSGAQIVVALINGISQNLPKIIPAVISAVKQIGATIRQHSGEIGKALDASIPGATKSLEKLKKAFEVILPAILLAKGAVEGFKVASAISGIIAGVTKVLGLQTTATQAQTLAQTGLNGVMKANVFGIVVTAIAAVVTALVALYQHNAKFRAQVNRLRDDLEKFASIIGNGAKKLFTETIPNAGKAMVDWFKDLPHKLESIGANMIKGLWNGIQKSIKWLNDKISGFCDGIVKNVKNALGIHSPSTVFAGIGGYMAKGLGVGFDNQIGSVKSQIERQLNFSAGAVKVNAAVRAERQSAQTDTFGNMLSGAVNAISGIVSNSSTAQPAQITLVTANGQALAKWLLTDIRSVSKSSPEVVSDTL